MNRKQTWGVSIALLALCVGCGERAAKQEPAAARRGDRAERFEVSDIPPAECEAFGWEFISAVVSSDSVAVCELVDTDRLARLAARGTDAPPKVYESLRDGIKHAADNGSLGLATDLVFAASNGASLHMLRALPDEGRPGVMLRMLTAEGGLNYLHLILTRNEQGEVRVADAFVFVSAEYISDALRRMMFAFMDEDSRGIVDRIAGRHNTFVESLPKLLEMRQKLQAGEYEEVLALYDALPKELQRERIAMVNRLIAAPNVSDEEYARAVSDFVRHAGKNARTDLVLMDGYVLKGDFDKAFECVDAIDRDVGGDAYLDVMRAGLYMTTGDLVSARKRAAAAAEEEPGLIEAYWALVGIALQEREFDDVARLLDVLIKQFGIEIGDLTGVPEYAEFVQSPQYALWYDVHSHASESQAPPVNPLDEYLFENIPPETPDVPQR